MKRLIFGLAALPFMAGLASAEQPLTNAQMDAVTAGFSGSALASADASAIGSIVSTSAQTMNSVRQVLQTMTNLTVVKSSVLSQSVSIALPTSP